MHRIFAGESAPHSPSKVIVKITASHYFFKNKRRWFSMNINKKRGGSNVSDIKFFSINSRRRLIDADYRLGNV